MIQWSQGQDVRHVTMVSRVMGMEVVYHVHPMNCVVPTLHPYQTVFCLTVINVGSVHQGIILMIQVVHV